MLERCNNVPVLSSRNVLLVMVLRSGRVAQAFCAVGNEAKNIRGKFFVKDILFRVELPAFTRRHDLRWVWLRTSGVEVFGVDFKDLFYRFEVKVCGWLSF